ncbi:hypothetical protein K438DRAFT_1599145 [Mycena galopus ATCC 62051]|nr:hypothetical protein K438DRAFT_1599145 [Mycena galopus ATCC 62051]
MILTSLGLPYEILEASSTRIGGRIYTHRFNGDAGRDAKINDPARYDYVDMGAMRFPKIRFMDRVFKLFEDLKMEEDGLLVEYKYSSPNTFQQYNGIRVRQNSSKPPGADSFRVSEENGGAVPSEYVSRGIEQVSKDIFEPFAEDFKKLPFDKAWEKLVEKDAYSTRTFLLAEKKFPETVVEWMETFTTATGLYDGAFVESTMDAMDFGSPTASRNAGIVNPTELEYPWVCIDGGADHLTQRMVDKISPKPATGMRVTKIASTSSGEMDVVYQAEDGQTHEKTFSQVICTVPLGCLAAIEIPENDLSYMQRMAIRSLQYDTSTKIALKFESRWWEDPEVMGKGCEIRGGSSSTDLPIRTCVYPSYGLNTTGKAPGAILASYTWAQDAQRLGGLAQAKGTEADKRLVELTLQNLSQLHGVPIEKFGPLLDHYAFNWHNDDNARGAFALFGPGQFGNPHRGNSMFASMKAPAANGKLHIAGEATSVHHAWVLGALNSAWRAVYNALGKLGPGETDKKREQLKALWGIPTEENLQALLELAALAKAKVL